MNFFLFFIVNVLKKVFSGIVGFDEIIGGGLLCGCMMLLVGGFGFGKIIFVL